MRTSAAGFSADNPTLETFHLMRFANCLKRTGANGARNIKLRRGRSSEPLTAQENLVARAKHCTWKGTVARGVYKPSCSTTQVLGIPPRPGAECPGCGRPVVHFRPKHKTAGIEEYRRWKKRRAQTVTPSLEHP